jgi:hypothetical protein
MKNLVKLLIIPSFVLICSIFLTCFYVKYDINRHFEEEKGVVNLKHF